MIFVCLGISVDDIFVVVNAFKQTRDMFPDNDGSAIGKPNMTEDEVLRYVMYRDAFSFVSILM